MPYSVDRESREYAEDRYSRAAARATELGAYLNAITNRMTNTAKLAVWHDVLRGHRNWNEARHCARHYTELTGSHLWVIDPRTGGRVHADLSPSQRPQVASQTVAATPAPVAATRRTRGGTAPTARELEVAACRWNRMWYPTEWRVNRLSRRLTNPRSLRAWAAFLRTKLDNYPWVGAQIEFALNRAAQYAERSATRTATSSPRSNREYSNDNAYEFEPLPDFEAIAAAFVM